ncbi:very short patch repair endonuclease [Alloalcanivorax marinus]|uniref:very short patch repair endonuclease n=1 Tax=Alloalcanivorax marinus TaxID=1177169 RepID=UPI00195C4204|nr:very short patch repair endonuclease [Alloalcanivorax marinus]MBM7332887.1 DNA mismatch endonuclease Vsr [Alloalcanivorax marinus]
MDVLTEKQRKLNMRRIGPKNTKPEMLVRRALHARGFRYRLHDKKLPGKPDLVFPRYRCVIFVNGCFWHNHNCSLFKWPKTNRQFWMDKLEGNRLRDQRKKEELIESGWRVLVIWECAIKGVNRLSVDDALERATTFIRSGSGYREIGEKMP